MSRILVLVALACLAAPACGRAPGPRRVKDLGTWKGGTLTLMASERSGDAQLTVVWESGGRKVTLSGPWREIPLVKDVPTGDLVLVVGEPGRYNLQVWKAPEGPFSAKYVGTHRDIERELGRLYPGPGK